MAPDANKALIRRYVEDVMNEHDAAASAAFFAPDAINNGRQVEGDRMRIILDDIFATFPDWHTTIEELLAEGEAVVCHSVTTATHGGTPVTFPIHNMLGIPATGKPVVMRSIHIFHLKDGLITSHRAVRDDLETMKQIGLWPLTGAPTGVA